MPDNTNAVKRLTGICTLIRFFILTSIIILPLTAIVFPLAVQDYFRNSSGEVLALSMKYKFLFALISFIANIPPMIFLVKLLNLFSGYQRLEFFTCDQVRLFKEIGLWLLITSLSYFLLSSLEDFVNNDVHGRFALIISFDGQSLAIPCAALISYCLGLVMQEAMIIKKDTDLTI